MRNLAPGSAHARPSAQAPIDTSRIFLTHMSLRGGQKVIQQLSEGRGVPQILFHPKSYYFCELKPHAKFRTPMITPSGRKVTVGEEREKKTALIVDT
jgi:hypothetical protein